MSDDLARMDATAQAELVRSGEASPAELLDAAIARSEAVNPEINAIIHALSDEARAAAADGLPDGPFKGVPFLLKDLGAASPASRSTWACSVLKDADFRAPVDTFLAAALPRRRAGHVRQDQHPRARHPADDRARGLRRHQEPLGHRPHRRRLLAAARAPRSPPGIVPMAHANDGGGSIRIPASNCGLVGLKPTRQRISEGPLVGDNLSGLTAELVVSRSVRDTARILDAVQGAAPGDPYVAPPPLRPYADELTDESTGCGSA